MRNDEDKGWADEEFDSVNLPDKRLDARLRAICESMSASPESPINQACCDWAETKAAYRFFANERVDPADIIAAHNRKTVNRMEGLDTVLAIQDTSYLIYTGHKKTTGLGEISATKGRHVERLVSKGLVMHACLAVTTNGLPLGLLDLNVFARKPKVSPRQCSPKNSTTVGQKEIHRWVSSLENCSERSTGTTRVVTVCDREADFYDFLDAGIRSKSPILVRAKVDRAVNKKSRYAEKDVVKLWKFMENQEVAGIIEIDIPAKDAGKRGSDRQARRASLEVKIGSFMLNAPRNHIRTCSETLPSLRMQAIHAIENNPPAGVEPVEWMLLTNLPVAGMNDAREMIRWYSLRWRIELFFKMLKSGFKILECRLGDAQRLKKYITVMSVVAWRMMMLTYLARTEPNLSCDEVLSSEEWKLLYRRTHRNENLPQAPPPMKEAIILIARLGGFLGRKGDGDPGMITIWRGWKRLSDLSEGWYLNNSDDTCG
ncbi:IS4 family transposase [Puniceicoccaceae bacterium K14]|nr:IS4 family transposase [Puniceicoccaceae bacterium K14]